MGKLNRRRRNQIPMGANKICIFCGMRDMNRIDYATLSGLVIRVAGCQQANIDGDYAIEREMRNRRFCFSK